MAESVMTPKVRVGAESGGVLLEYFLKALLVAGLCELILYRLVSRLGMHLSKVAKEYVVVEYFLRGASAIGFVLMNFSAILVFLVLLVLLFYKMNGLLARPLDRIVVPMVSLLLALTAAFLLFPPRMLGAVVYNGLTLVLLWTLVIQYCRANPAPTARALALCYGAGVSGWLYYQISTTTYGWLGIVSTPPLVHEISRLGEALMVVATVLVFAVYSGFTFRTKNRQQRRRSVQFAATWAALFLALLVMGYTFYLPFALYVAGLLFWSYTVIKQISMGRRAGYGLVLMFIAGYALQLSHLTLFVIVGLLLLVNDGRIDARESVGQMFPAGMPDRPAAAAPGVS